MVCCSVIDCCSTQRNNPNKFSFNSHKAKIQIQTPSSSSSEQWNNPQTDQEHARIRASTMSPITSDTSTSVSFTSLTSSIHRFRTDFDEIKCKMKIFGESLNLCRCIASDFKSKLVGMERRLESLERRQKVERSESNYSAIIQKNKVLSHKTMLDARKLQMCGTEEEMREVAARICRNYLHGAWKSVDAKQIDFRRISGGLSNFLYYVALPDDTSQIKYTHRESSPDEEPDSVSSLRGLMKKGLNRNNSFVIEEPKKVLLRIYGQVHGERAMDAIVTESVIFTLLSERRLGPKLHGVFSGGRIEEYIPARSLLTKELAEPALSMKIAEKMAAIHSMDVPLSKEPNWLWKTMGKWLKTVREERLAGIQGKNEEEQRIIKRLKNVEFDKEIEWVKKFIATVDSPVVFCHNDLQEGNILILEDVVQGDDEVSSEYVQAYKTEMPKSDKENNHTHSHPDLCLTENIGSAENIRSPDLRSDLRSSDLRSSDLRSSDLPPSDLRASDNLIHDTADNILQGIAVNKRVSTIEQISTFEDANTSDSIMSHISDSGEPRLVLIDFEYCAYNYRGFDIANHFQEWGYDYTNPEHPFYFENQENCPTLEQKEIFIREYLKHYHLNISEDKDAPAATIDEVNHLLNEVDAFALASHLFWCLWSVVNASKSQIPFGYWEYALSRLETYLRLKQEVVKKDKFGFPQKRKICEVDI